MTTEDPQYGDELNGLLRRTFEDSQIDLFPSSPQWTMLWWGMPEFAMKDARPRYQITVNIYCVDDLREFASRLGLNVTTKTDSVTFPQENIGKPSDWEYVDEE